MDYVWFSIISIVEQGSNVDDFECGKRKKKNVYTMSIYFINGV